MTWILGLPMVFLMGLIQGGVISRVEDADFARYFNLWITVYMLVAFVLHFLENIHRLDHLPIARGLLLRWLLVPSIVALLAGGLVGAAIDAGRAPEEALGFENDSELAHHGLLVPVDLWRPFWGEPPARVEAPWGESRPVTSVAVIAGWPLHLWKPYSTGPEASADFVAWQISRAAEAAHGVAVDPDLIRERYLVTGADGDVQVGPQGLALVADGIVPARGFLGPVLGLLVGTIVVAGLLICGLIFRVCGPGATRRRVRFAFWGAMGGLMALHLGGYSLLMTRTVTDWQVSALVGGLAGRLGQLGVWGWAGTWLIAALAAGIAWRLCSSAFARVEAVRGGTSCAL